MLSLQKLMGKDDRFLTLLEAAAAEARHSVKALIEGLHSREGAPALGEFVLARRAEKQIAEQISHELVRTFVTELEREDIEALRETLYKIPKTVEKFAERYALSFELTREANFTRHLKLLESGAQLVVELVAELRDIGAGRLEKVKGLNARLQAIEGEADKLIVEVLRDLWSGRYETTYVIVVKDLYELLEKVADRCRDVGKTVTQIVLKNS